jgi:hypothetical protein
MDNLASAILNLMDDHNQIAEMFELIVDKYREQKNYKR